MPQELNLPSNMWNPLMLGCRRRRPAVCLAAAVVLAVVLRLAAAAGLGPTLVYVSVRNEKVADDERRADASSICASWPATCAASSSCGEARSGRGRRIADPLHRQERERERGRHRPRRAGAGLQAATRRRCEMVYEAVQTRATDIHLEPTKDEMTVRFRIDGILQPATPFSRPMGDAVINIFKVLADLDITEKRKPQDGSFSAAGRSDHVVDFRVATAGSVVGEKTGHAHPRHVRSRSPTSTQLGMRDKMREQIHEHRHAAARHVHRLRPDRGRQEHHAVRLPQRDRPLPEERHHHREPGRVPHRQRHADRDQPQGRQDLRRRSCAASCGRTPT